MVESRDASCLSRSSLRTVLFAGEIFPLKHLRRLHVLLPQASLFNLYGPTETNVCTFFHVASDALNEDRWHSLPIGQPCEYATVFTIDDNRDVVDLAPGEEGQLCIGGDSVMLGYWGDPEKTARAFISCPVTTARDGRAYLSGDIVTRDKRGNYIFLRRRDHLIKRHGFRIELGEIEHVLLAHAQVHEAAVVAVPVKESDLELVAYLRPVPGATLEASDLRRHCLEFLPRYMVPDVFEFVDGLPHTSTEKVDRQSLGERAVRLVR